MPVDTVLYFGSFNPVHKGHTAVAEYVVEQGYCDELWFVVSPQNPLKPAGELAPDEARLEMVRIAVAELDCADKVKVCDVEFGMPKPSYTIDTVNRLAAEFPERRFIILGGTDVIEGIERWKDYRELLDKCRFLIYPRDGYSLGKYADRAIYLKGAPTWSYSSTEVRERIAEDADVSGMLSEGVLEYIKEHKIWI